MELDNLIKNVRDFFLSQFSQSNTKTFVSFEPLGHMISPDDFKFQGNFDPTVASEELSRMCDKIPQISDVFITDGINSISQAYGSIINSMQFTPNGLTPPAGKTLTAEDKQPYFEKVANMKANALRKFQSQASIEVPGEEIYLTHGSPTGWWDTKGTIWTKKTLTPATTTPVATETRPSLFVNNRLMWKVNPITTKVDTNKNIVNIVANPVVVTKMNMAVKSPKIMGPFVVRVPPAKRGIVPAPPFQVNKMPTFNKTTYIAANAAVPFNNKILMNRTFGDLKNTTTQEVKSNNFQMDFSYALVTLHRPWISGEVLENAKLWYVLGQKSGVYSSGETTATNQGLMRAFPKAMIVVKDLTITAQWSEDDRKAAQTSLGFGAFNISNSHFSESNKNQLQAPGIQILGWICEILTPKLPFNDDPLIA